MSTTRSNDRLSACAFTFADGRRCRMPRQSGHPFLCCFHARKDAQARAAEEVGRDVRFFLSGDYLSAVDLSLALGRVFSAAASGQLKPKTAGTLAYLGQTLLQTIHHAESEYINAFSTDSWRRVIRSHVKENSNYLFPAPPPAEAPSLVAATVPAPLSVAPPVSAETPDQLPAEAERQTPDRPASVEAGRNLSRPGQEPGPSYRGRPSAEAATLSPLASAKPQPIAAPANPQTSATDQPSAVIDSGHESLRASRLVGAQHRCALSAGRAKTPRGSSTQNSDPHAAVSSSPAPARFPRNAAKFASAVLSRSSQQPPTRTQTDAARPAVPALQTASPTGPSGAPILAAVPPRNPAPPPARRRRQIRPWYFPE